ncbi:hypothetical protein [Alcanivorax xiamenensis]|uniref:hypothetical protein n=1 Tax=Alcanivorax xiamenensis TaxID=1177156 RepID=UPI0034E1A01B
MRRSQFRHTMATHLALTGQIRSLREILGRTNVKTTMIYVHPDLEQLNAFLGHLPGLGSVGRHAKSVSVGLFQHTKWCLIRERSEPFVGTHDSAKTSQAKESRGG